MMSMLGRFEFTLPPYFLNNARAIGSLEGLAKTADPSFNLLAEVYSFSIRTLLTSDSPGMRKTLMDITYDPDTGKPSLRKV
jgi:aarF domain-containing kinase